MKVRIKFTKEGPMKFVGHLDTMRYFQKAIRRAELPIAFSGGYSPHMIVPCCPSWSWRYQYRGIFRYGAYRYDSY